MDYPPLKLEADLGLGTAGGVSVGGLDMWRYRLGLAPDGAARMLLARHLVVLDQKNRKMLILLGETTIFGIDQFWLCRIIDSGLAVLCQF